MTTYRTNEKTTFLSKIKSDGLINTEKNKLDPPPKPPHFCCVGVIFFFTESGVV